MLQTELGYFDCVRQALSGEKEVDEHTLDSVAILSYRLESLKALDPAFAGVEFSPNVRQMMDQQSNIVVS